MMLSDLLTKRNKIGLIFIYLAGLGWLAELVIPFTHLEHKGWVLFFNFLTAEAFFFIGAAILGKPVYLALKTRLLNLIYDHNQPKL